MRETDVESRARLTPIVQANSARAAAWRVFFEASGRLQGILETRLKRTYGVSMPDYNILLALWEAPAHRLRMGELADRVVYSPSRVTYLVSNLSRDGWVERIASKVDRRGYDACLTTQGIQTVLAATELHQQTVSEYLLDGMTDSDIDAIARVFSTLDSRLKGEKVESSFQLAHAARGVLSFYSLADRSGSHRSPARVAE